MRTETSSPKKSHLLECPMERRQFLKCSAFLGGSAAAVLTLGRWIPELADDGWAQTSPTGLQDNAYSHYLPENQIYSVCQQCNTNCGIKVKFVDGVVAKIDGNPYSPWTLTPHIAYDTPIGQAGTVEGGICPKGQAGIQTLYDL